MIRLCCEKYLAVFLKFLGLSSPFAVYLFVEGNFKPSLLSIFIGVFIALVITALLIFDVEYLGCRYADGLDKKNILQKISVYSVHFFIYLSVVIYYLLLPVHSQLANDVQFRGNYLIPIGNRGKKRISCSRLVEIKEDFLGDAIDQVCASKKDYKKLTKNKPLYIPMNKDYFRGNAIFTSSILGLYFVELEMSSD